MWLFVPFVSFVPFVPFSLVAMGAILRAFSGVRGWGIEDY